MTSKKKIEANRKNAERSTGPKTPIGKSRSRNNAQKFGYWTLKLIPSEDPREFENVRRDMFADLGPQTTFGICAVEQIVSEMWRIGRIMRGEHSTLTECINEASPAIRRGGGSPDDTDRAIAKSLSGRFESVALERARVAMRASLRNIRAWLDLFTVIETRNVVLEQVVSGTSAIPPSTPRTAEEPSTAEEIPAADHTIEAQPNEEEDRCAPRCVPEQPDKTPKWILEQARARLLASGQLPRKR